MFVKVYAKDIGSLHHHVLQPVKSETIAINLCMNSRRYEDFIHGVVNPYDEFYIDFDISSAAAFLSVSKYLTSFAEYVKKAKAENWNNFSKYFHVFETETHSINFCAERLSDTSLFKHFLTVVTK
jgi:hypothetical protein